MKNLLFFSPLGFILPLRAAPADLVRALQPLAVRGVNYYPAQTPWSGFWTKTPGEVIEKDMALCASLHVNAVRIFVPWNDFMDAEGAVAPAYLEKFEKFLAVAWQHGIRAVVCFEFVPRDKPLPEDAWKRAMSAFVTPHRDDGRVLLWDLVNEPESREWDEASRAY